jgi:hypothetical protein
MNLSISKEHGKAGLFGADYKVKARLNASDEEVQAMVQQSMGGSELTKLPNSLGSRFAYEPLYLAEILNRDWEGKCKTMQDAETMEALIIDACKQLKSRMEQPDNSGPKNIEL